MISSNSLATTFTYLILATVLCLTPVLTGLIPASSVKSLSLMPIRVNVNWGSDQGRHGALRATDNIDWETDIKPTNRFWQYTKIAGNQDCDRSTDFSSAKSYTEGDYIYPKAKDAGKRYCFRSATVVPAGPYNSKEFIHSGYGASDVIEFIAPRIVSITSHLADGNYSVDAVIPVKVHFSEPVFVYNQKPALRFNSKNPHTHHHGTYISGSGSRQLLFHLNFSNSDVPINDLDILAVTSDVCGATNNSTIVCRAIYDPIRDAQGNLANLKIPKAKSLAVTRNISIGKKPTPQPPVIPVTPVTPVTPTGPTTLPVTGGAPIAGLIAVSLLAAGSHRYLAIRRSLKS